MAKTIAKAWGIDRTRVKETHRLGHEAAKVQAATWRTFVTAYINADGSGHVDVERNRQKIFSVDFGPENE